MLAACFDVDQNEPVECRFFPARAGESVGRLSCLRPISRLKAVAVPSGHRDETLTVRVPVGVEEGMALRVPGHGLPAEKTGLPSGDLFVVVRTADDPRFERHGSDLYRFETVDVVDAILGSSIDVPTLEGQVSVRVPAGTQPDSMLRLRGKGLPQFGGGARGDFFVRLQIHVPERLNDRQRRLFEQIRTAAIRKSSSKI